MGMIGKIIIGVVVLVVLAVLGGWIYLTTAFPAAGEAPDISVESTPEAVARGAYLANHVTVCIDCHSTRDWAYYAGPIVAGSEGIGGERFGEEFGFPGTFYARNITPAGIGNWTDGEIARAITSGVRKDGSAFFPVMPYHLAYNRLAEDDLHALIAYVRTLKPIEADWPASQLNFPVSIIVNTIPEPYHAQPAPDPSDELAYGEYLATIAACAECHTPMVKGEKIAGMDYAGGFEFPLPTGVMVRSANITPDLKTGIGGWDLNMFTQKFRTFATESVRRLPAGEGEPNTVMPWLM